METDQAQCLLLQAGEQILCTRCQAPLAVADVDVYAPASLRRFRLLEGVPGRAKTEPPTNGYQEHGDRQLLCRCGGGARGSGRDRLLVRSGSWIGWRELGGE